MNRLMDNAFQVALMTLLAGGAVNVKADEPILLTPVHATAGTNYEVQQRIPVETFENEIHLQETAPGLKSPYLGAFTGNQVDQTVNGIRMNNALFRGGPNQYYSWIPSEFTQSVTLSDGGNVGGSINRTLGVSDTSVGLSYNGALRGFSETGSYHGDQFSFSLKNTNTGNVHTADGEVPHSAYNQSALMAEAKWNPTNKTTFLYSRSHDIERTDKWNGGWRSSGFQAPSVYTWQLQEYMYLNHKLSYGGLDLNLGYQDSTEHILDGKTQVRTNLKAYTVNANYSFNDNWSAYSTNTYEDIFYHNGVTSDANDAYVTMKQGARYDKDMGFATLAISGGLKQVRVSGFDPFETIEGSVVVSKNGYFLSVDESSNAPSYASLKQSTTSGKGKSRPNPNLKGYSDYVVDIL